MYIESLGKIIFSLQSIVTKSVETMEHMVEDIETLERRIDALEGRDIK